MKSRIYTKAKTISTEEYDKLKTENTGLHQAYASLESEYSKYRIEAEKRIKDFEKIIEDSEKIIKDSEFEIKRLSELLAIAKAKKFGRSSEKLDPEVMEQLSLFANEAEVYKDTKPETEEEIKIAEHIRRKEKSSVMESVPDNIEHEVVEHRLDNPVCPNCGAAMVEIGKETRSSLVIIPAQVKVRDDIYYTYACKNCEKKDISTPIKKAPRDNPVIKGSFASAEAVSTMMTEKLSMGSPLYRQETRLRMMGIDLSRQTMSNWILTASELWLEKLYDKLHEELITREVLHADETTLRVLKEKDKTSNSKCYMWLYRTSGDTDKHIVLYDYQRDRKSEHPKEFLKGFKGYVHADGYAGYHNLPEEITVVGCFAHLKKKFHEAAIGGSKDRNYITASQTGEAYISKISRENNKLGDLSPEERKEARLKIVKPIFEALLLWAETVNAAKKSKLGEAIFYLKDQKKYLENFFLDGRLELTNNRAERSIKPFVIDRKNFLFANTPSGAKQTGIMMSIIETAKENKLDPYKYLRWLFVKMPNTDLTVKNSMNEFLPWNAPDECRARG